MEDSNNATLVEEIVGCAITADPSKNLKIKLLRNMKTPDFVILREAMNTCITRALEKQRDEYLEFAALLGQWITVIPILKMEPIWTYILTEDNPSAMFENEKSKWCWEKFFDLELRNNRNANQHDEQMRILYNAKRISLFRAKHHSKVLFRLLKLGADPFEQKQSKDKTHTKTLTYAIISSKKLTRMKCIHLLNHLLKRNLLRLDPSGPRDISPLQLCLTDQRKRHALKILLKVGGFDKVQLKGDNILMECKVNNGHYEHILSFLTVEQIKQLLKQPNNSFEALFNMKPHRYPSYFENFFTAMKELLHEYPDTIWGKLENINRFFPPQFFVQYNNSKSEIAKNYWKNCQSSAKPSADLTTDLKFNGDTEFPFEHLPVELSEMICSYLPMQDRIQLLSTSKSMRGLQDAFGEYYWKTALKFSWPVIYSQIDNKLKNQSWHDRTLSAFRSAENWKQGKFTKKFIRYNGSIQTPYGHHFDEHWLCAGRGSNLMFWNCTNGSEEFEHYQKMSFSGWSVSYLTSTPSAPPNFAVCDTSDFGYCVNNNFKAFKTINFFKKQISMSSEVTALTEKTFIVKHGIFDIELEKVIATFPYYSNNDNLDPHAFIRTSKKLLFSNNIISATVKDVIIFDKDLRQVAKSDPLCGLQTDRLSYASLGILDEYLVYYSATGYPYNQDHHSVIDIRTMKKVHSSSKWLSRVNNAGRTMLIERGICTIWNVKNNTWETTFSLPNEANDSSVSNSRYIAFGCHAEPKNSTMVVLDFDSMGGIK